MTDLDKLVEFYTTPVTGITALEELARADLPPNLHIEMDYHRYNPETDGPTAFPKRSTKVSGLKAKKMGLKGYKAQKEYNYLKWPTEQWKNDA